MAVAPQKLANKSMTSLILGSQLQHNKQLQTRPQLKRHKTYYHKKKRRGHIYNDSEHCSTPRRGPYGSYNDNNKHSYYDEDDSPIDPSKIHRISRKIKDSFYTMSEVDPLMRQTKTSKTWPLIPFRSNHESTKTNQHFRMKEIDHMDHDESIMVHGHEQEEQIIYYYDHEQEQQKIFYAQLHLNIDDIFGKKAVGGSNNIEATELDLVLNEYHTNRMNLPEIEHYFILLYYNIKKSSIGQLQSLWSKLYGLFSSKMKQNIPLPTIYINFKNGEEPTNINSIFSMLYHPELGIDIVTLKEVVKEYYYQWHPKCILGQEMEQKIEDRFAGMLDLDEVDPMENITDEHEQIFGHQFWSISDQNYDPNAMPALTPNWRISRSPTPEAITDTPHGDTPIGVENILSPDSKMNGTLFGFKRLRPKTAVITSVLGMAAFLVQKNQD